LAASVAIKNRIKFGNAYAVIADVTFDSSYATGGEEVKPAQLGLRNVFLVQAGNSGGYAFEYDYTNTKLKAYYGDNDSASDGPLVEVPNATNLSAVTARIVAYGR